MPPATRTNSISAEECLGKSPGQDFALGELTLPLIYLFEGKDEASTQGLRDCLLSGKDEAFVKIKEALQASGALDRTHERMMGYIQQAQELLGQLDASAYTAALGGLVDFIVQRTSKGASALTS